MRPRPADLAEEVCNVSVRVALRAAADGCGGFGGGGGAVVLDRVPVFVHVLVRVFVRVLVVAIGRLALVLVPDLVDEFAFAARVELEQLVNVCELGRRVLLE